MLLPLGIDLPEEARVWWRWRDGVLPGARPGARAITPHRDKFALADAADEHAYERDVVLDAWGLERLLQPVGDLPLIHFHCAGPRNDPVPVYTTLDYTEPPRLVLPSIAALVHVWIGLVESGAWTTDPRGRWVEAADAVPEEVRALGVT